MDEDVVVDGGSLSLAEWVCLALIESGARHGWAIVKELEPEASLGAVWSLTPQLTYRAVEQLTRKGLLTKVGVEPGRGQGKVLLAITPAGHDAVRHWLDQPVGHVREVRTEGLLKLLLRTRLGLENQDFIRAQQDTLRPIIDRLLGPGHATSDLADVLRREHARAAQRFLATALTLTNGSEAGATEPVAGSALSADNALVGVVTTVVHGDTLSTVKMALDDGQTISAVISRQRAEALGLAPGDSATAYISATNVMVGLLANDVI